jgi:hypothetical protein
MSVFAASPSTFTTVVIAVCLVGCAVAVVVLLRSRDAFSRERGGLWMFHGEPDTGPHVMPGTREHDRHVIDPTTGVEAPPAPAAKAGGYTGPAKTNGGVPVPKSKRAGVAAGKKTSAAATGASDDFSEWDQAVPPMDS